MILDAFIASAHAADLPLVDPPGECWLGLAIAAVVVIGVVLLVGYIVHIKRKPGIQAGEEQINRLLNLTETQAATIAKLTAPALIPSLPIATQPPAKYPADWE